MDTISEKKEHPCTIADVRCSGICKDYDEDCKEVKDHFKCWLGGKVVIDSEGYECDRSNGLCPFIHHCN
jgi:hypothetical protein